MTEDKSGLSSIYTPNDKKRIALLNGAIGQANRISIKGQVVDIPISEEQKKEQWHHFHGLPKSLQDNIHPLQDFTMSVVRRPRLQIEILNIHPDKCLPKVPNNCEILYSSKEFTAGDDSFFTHKIDTSLQPGEYVVQVILRGIDSLRQSVSDLSYVRHSDSLILKKDLVIGYGKVLVLHEDYSGYIITSDIDQTFLDTPMQSRRGLVETLFQKPAAKSPVAGMPMFFQKLQQSHSHLQENQEVLPTLFISASPHFFRRSLSVVFENNNIKTHALHLKYLVSTIDNILQKVRNTALNFNEFLSGGMNEAMDRSLKFISSSLASLFDQIAYKLTILLENRLMHPTGTKEILMGDNTEGDYFIFVLYQYLLLGKLKGKDLENYLYNLNFQDKEVITRDTSKIMLKLTEENLKLHGKLNPVEAVWINQSGTSPNTAEMHKIVSQSLHKSLAEDFCKADNVKKPICCYAGAGFSLAALDLGIIGIDQVNEVFMDSLNKNYAGNKITKSTLKKLVSDFSYNQINKPELEMFSEG